MKKDQEVDRVKAMAMKSGFNWTDSRVREFIKMIEETKQKLTGEKK